MCCSVSYDNEFTLAVAEGARDGTTLRLYRERLDKLEHDMREMEMLLACLANNVEGNQNLLIALDNFDVWAISQQEFFRNPDCKITKEDKRAVLLILGANSDD